MREVRIGQGDSAFVAIRILRREYPQATNDWQRNWVVGEVEITVPPWHGRFSAEFLTFEFARLRDELEGLCETARREATFTPKEPSVRLTFKADASGRIGIEGEAQSIVGWGPRLLFHLPDTARTSLRDVIEQLREVERAFPS